MQNATAQSLRPDKGQRLEHRAAVAVKFIDYWPEPEVQARWLSAYKAIPVNQKAYGQTAPQLLDPATRLPWTKSKGFRNDIQWWAANRTKVSRRRWSK